MARAGRIRVTHPCAGRRHPVSLPGPLPLDLHVLSLPLAFILSQDQTLRCICISFSIFSLSRVRPPRLFFYFFSFPRPAAPASRRRQPPRLLVLCLPHHVNDRFSLPPGVPESGCKYTTPHPFPPNIRTTFFAEMRIYFLTRLANTSFPGPAAFVTLS